MGKKTFEKQIEQVKEKLYRYAYCYVKNEHDALEIVSEVIYKAYLSYNKIKQIDYFETWITRILINTSIDYLKKNRKIVSMDSVPEQTAPQSPVSLEEKVDLYEALNRLDETDRAYIVLKYFENKSFREIAEIYEIPEGTAKTKIYRILKKLRYNLEKGGLSHE